MEIDEWICDQNLIALSLHSIRRSVWPRPYHSPQSHYVTTVLINVSLTLHSIPKASPSPLTSLPDQHREVPRPRKSTQHHETSLFTRGAPRQDDRSSPLGFGSILTAYTPHCSFATTSSPNHGYKLPTTEALGRRPIFTERGCQGPESREGILKRYAGYGRF